ncbi:MAG TPA: hypothetical protein VIM33_08725 [Gaiellaceae bacterium]|jgi:hypothetical protein
MSWGDSELGLPPIKATVAVLNEGRAEFQKLVACKDDELVETISKLSQNDLRSIVLERVIAARYGAGPRFTSSS